MYPVRMFPTQWGRRFESALDGLVVVLEPDELEITAESGGAHAAEHVLRVWQPVAM
jgi:hypothetical protein